MSPAPRVSTLPPRTFRLLCGIPVLANDFAQLLHQNGWEVRDNAPLTLLIDGPWGVGLAELERAEAGSLIVVTDNPCPEYWDDLWDLRPRALLVGGHSIAEVAEALRRASAGEFFRHAPHHDPVLSAVERRMLRLSASGLENKQIARQLGFANGSVKNALNRVFSKLGFSNRTQAALYYWGLWHLLEAHPLRSHVHRDD